MTRSGCSCALALVIAMTGCVSGDAGTAVLRVQLRVDDCAQPPELITFPCDGRVGVWLVDDTFAIQDEFCVGMPQGTPLPGLDNVLEANDVRFTGLEIGDTIALELAVFTGTAGEFCVRPFGDMPSDPQPELDSENIFLSGRSNLVTLEQTTEILVPLSCGFLEEQCDPVFTAKAIVTDLDTLVPQTDPLIIERVQFGFALDGSFESLGDLAFDGSLYSANLASAPPSSARCVGAAVTSPLSPLDILSCDGSVEGDEANILAYTIDPAVLDRLETLAGVPGDIGEILIGRVVDPSKGNAPVAGMHVESQRGAIITYPDLDFDGSANLFSTGKDGYFVMSGPDSECCQILTAVGNDGVAGGVSEPTGTVSGMYSVTVISSNPLDDVEPEPVPPTPTRNDSQLSQTGPKQ